MQQLRDPDLCIATVRNCGVQIGSLAFMIVRNGLLIHPRTSCCSTEVLSKLINEFNIQAFAKAAKVSINEMFL